MMKKLANSKIYILFAALIVAVSPAFAMASQENHCATPEGYIEGGIGGTGYRADIEKGIGGTGVSLADAGKEPIYVRGTITDFGSICVNGLRVTYDDNTPVITTGNDSVPVSQLQVGQFVHVLAESAAEGAAPFAKAIELRNLLEGPVTHVDAARGELSVMGEAVRLYGVPAILNELKVGDRVRISGLRNEHYDAVASLIAAGDTIGTNLVFGEVIEDDDGLVKVGHTRVDFSQVKEPALEEMVTVSGEWKDNILVATQVEQDTGLRNLEVGYVSLEGYVEEVSEDGKIAEMCDQDIMLGEEHAGEVETGERAILSGVLNKDGSITVKTISKRRGLSTQ